MRGLYQLLLTRGRRQQRLGRRRHIRHALTIHLLRRHAIKEAKAALGQLAEHRAQRRHHLRRASEQLRRERGGVRDVHATAHEQPSLVRLLKRLTLQRRQRRLQLQATTHMKHPISPVHRQRRAYRQRMCSVLSLGAV
jgi:hypothetical protein